MSRIEKLIERLLAEPTDFTIREMETLLLSFGYEKSKKGRTSGSRIRFYKEGYAQINLHIPHPNKVLKEYVVKEVVAILKEAGLI
jgi:predicted RNA binding protein YcfA (HicA-like mRNA interferase family)